MSDLEKQSLLKSDESQSFYTSTFDNAGVGNGGDGGGGGSGAEDDGEGAAGSAVAAATTEGGTAGDVGSSAVPFMGPGEVPPSYHSSTSSGGAPMVTCRVCQNMIDITNKQQHVVKCLHCNEATPIRNAPAGKKYVRCPCNCLLICKSSSQRIACPRSNCKRIINLAPSPVTPPAASMPGMCEVTCGHCSDTFLFNTRYNKLARCPHCRKVSSVGTRFAKGRFYFFAILGLLFFVTGIGISVSTYSYAKTHGGIFVAYIGIFLIAGFLFARSIFYFRLKVSNVDAPM